MNRKSLSQVKNLMHRALVDLTDPLPKPSEQALIREHFQHRCAYCDGPAPERVGHIDHAEHKGGNQLGNLILACGKCNGDEKRETPWEEFLRKKCGGDAAVLEARKQRIEAWMARNPLRPKLTTPQIEEAIQSAERAIEAFATAYNGVRQAIAAASGKGPAAPASRADNGKQ